MMNGKYVAVTKNCKIRPPNEVIFPILKQMEDDSWRLIGTGFFITKHGIFLTAKHVLRDVLDSYTNEQTHPIVAMLFTSATTYQIRRVTKGFLNVPGDIAAGVITNTDESGKLLGNGFYGLNRKPLLKGQEVHTYAYPKTIHNKNKINFHGNYYDGIIDEYLPTGRDCSMLPNACYQTSMQILPGASGAPVFNSSGNVIGINSSSFNDSTPPYVSFISCITDAFGIVFEGITLPCGYREYCTLEDLCNLGYVTTC